MRSPPRPILVAIALGVALGVALAGCSVTHLTERPVPSPVPSPAMVPATHTNVTLAVGAAKRSFLVWTPRHLASDKLPVIVALHGAGGSASEFAHTTGFARLTSAASFIAVYPNGTPLFDNHRAWNAGTCCGAPVEKKIDDIGFLSAVFDRLASTYGADPRRIYLAGFSNGGMLAYRAACDLGPRIAGIAVVSGALNVSSCASTNPMPILIIHGTADSIVPMNGGQPVDFHAYGLKPWMNASIAQAVAAWTARDGCSGAPDRTVIGRVTQTRYAVCSAGTTVTVRIRGGGGHVWLTGTTSLIVASFLGSVGHS